MKIITAATLCLLLSSVAIAQTGDRKSGEIIAADFNRGIELDRCDLRQEGDGVSVTAKLFVRFQPDQRFASEDGLDLEIVPSASGDAPSVSAHAINTKGTGATNGRVAAQECNVAPSPRGTIPAGARTIAASATCSLSAEADGVAWSFTLPIAAFGSESSGKKYVGHVSLIKRGDQTGGAKIIANCGSQSGAKAGYDLAVLKKA